jgi:hypothetical protein
MNSQADIKNALGAKGSTLHEAIGVSSGGTWSGEILAETSLT